jgi:tetratricopeptide (TPR) repeat protein
MGRADEAAPLLARAVESLTEQKQFTSAAVAAGNLGMALRKLGDYEGALKSSERALAIFRAGGNRVAEARELLLRANTYSLLKDWKKARDCHAASLKLADAIGNTGDHGPR